MIDTNEQGRPLISGNDTRRTTRQLLSGTSRTHTPATARTQHPPQTPSPPPPEPSNPYNHPTTPPLRHNERSPFRIKYASFFLLTIALQFLLLILHNLLLPLLGWAVFAYTSATISALSTVIGLTLLTDIYRHEVGIPGRILVMLSAKAIMAFLCFVIFVVNGGWEGSGGFSFWVGFGLAAAVVDWGVFLGGDGEWVFGG